MRPELVNMAPNQRVVFTLMALLLGTALQVAYALSHQQASSQQQVEPGKIISPSETANLNRFARDADDKTNFIDLSHPLNNDTIHWPGNKGLKHVMTIDMIRKDPRNVSYYVRSDEIDTAMHVGTHLDAPSHFGKDGWSVDKIPLERLIDVPLTVVDLSAKVKENRSYSFTKEDFHKNGKSLVKANSVLLVYTGISQDWDKGTKSYLGTERPDDLTSMKSAGFGLEAAKFLVEQKIFGVGLDAISADSSARQSVPNMYDPVAHVTFNENNIYILENVNMNLQKLIGKDPARLSIAPLPIVGGTGSPVRLVASLGHDHCHEHVSNGAGDQERLSSSTSLLVILSCIFAIMV